MEISFLTIWNLEVINKIEYKLRCELILCVLTKLS